MHAWETRSTHFDYYFFTAELLLPAAGAARGRRPRPASDRRLRGASVIPSDTVRVVLDQPGLVPSHAAAPFAHDRHAAAKGGAERASRCAAPRRGPPPRPTSPPRRRMPTTPNERQALDARRRLRLPPVSRGAQGRAERRVQARASGELLLARGRAGRAAPGRDEHARTVDAPERGHATLRLSARHRHGRTRRRHSRRWRVRGAIHDYLDPPAGYPADARLQMGDLRLRFDDQTRRLQPRSPRLRGHRVGGAARPLGARALVEGLGRRRQCARARVRPPRRARNTAGAACTPGPSQVAASRPGSAPGARS